MNTHTGRRSVSWSALACGSFAVHPCFRREVKESIRPSQPMPSSMQKSLFPAKYELLEEIARGGMGVIYKAVHTALHRPVAIKVLYPEYRTDASFLKRFEREARALARLDHPHIIRIYDVSEEQNPYYIVMELFPGKDLKQLILEKQPFSPPEACAMILQAAEALSFAHSKGIIHRDIKPGNILVDRDGRVKITDFGIVAAADELSATPTGEILGTPEYMSPEQARGEQIDGRSDLYSLGVVLYKMLTGRTPFEGISRPSIIGKLISDHHEFVLSFSPAIPSPLQDLVRSLLRKRAEDRVIDAKALTVEIRKINEAMGYVALKEEASLRPSLLAALPEGETPPFDGASPAPVSPGASADLPCTTAPIGRADGEKIRNRRSSLLMKGGMVLLLIGGIYNLLSPPLFPTSTETPPAPDPKMAEGPGEIPIRNEGHPIEGAVPAVEIPAIPASFQAAEIRAQEPSSKSQVERTALAISKKRDKQEKIVTDRESSIDHRSAQEQTELSPLKGAPMELNDRLTPTGHPEPTSLKQAEPIPMEAATEPPEAPSPPPAEIPLVEADQREERSSSEAPQQIAGQTAPPASLSSYRPDLETISDLLARFKTAFEAREMATLLQITEMSATRAQMLEEMFLNYPIIKISYSDLSLTRDTTTLTIVVYKLVDREGDLVSPHKEWKRSHAIIKKEGERWGKLIW